MKRRKISDIIDAGWCQGADARNVCGKVVSVYSSNAAKFSLLGAAQAAYEGRLLLLDANLEKIDAAISGRKASSTYSGIIEALTVFNDESASKEKVLELLDSLRL
jgi:hypothetical protein